MSEAANGAGAETQPQLQVNVQYVKDLSFENPNAPQSLIPTGEAPSVELNVNVSARGLAEGVFEVELELSATAKHADKVAFVVELTYGGVFTLAGVPEEHIQPMLLIECPRLLFPFARAIIANTTREGGFPPLMVHPIDFVDLFRQRVMATQGNA